MTKFIKKAKSRNLSATLKTSFSPVSVFRKTGPRTMLINFNCTCRKLCTMPKWIKCPLCTITCLSTYDRIIILFILYCTLFAICSKKKKNWHNTSRSLCPYWFGHFGRLKLPYFHNTTHLEEIAENVQTNKQLTLWVDQHNGTFVVTSLKNSPEKI